MEERHTTEERQTIEEKQTIEREYPAGPVPDKTQFPQNK